MDDQFFRIGHLQTANAVAFQARGGIVGGGKMPGLGYCCARLAIGAAPFRPAALDRGRYQRFAAFLIEQGVIKATPPVASYAVELR